MKLTLSKHFALTHQKQFSCSLPIVGGASLEHRFRLVVVSVCVLGREHSVGIVLNVLIRYVVVILFICTLVFDFSSIKCIYLLFNKTLCTGLWCRTNWRIFLVCFTFYALNPGAIITGWCLFNDSRKLMVFTLNMILFSELYGHCSENISFKPWSTSSIKRVPRTS